VSSEELVFSSMVEGMVRAVADKLDDRAHAHCAELGIALRGKLHPTYSREAWTKVSLYVGGVLWPMLKPEEQRRQLGHRFVEGYTETMVGKALIAAMRVLGPKRALARLEKSFRTGNNYSKAELVDGAEGLFMIIANSPYPEWYQGMIEKALERTGATDIRVESFKREGDTTTFRIGFR
jgi:uncharacterized protein (TIGR02265 family)